jgi:hypothetical protein
MYENKITKPSRELGQKLFKRITSLTLEKAQFLIPNSMILEKQPNYSSWVTDWSISPPLKGSQGNGEL